MIKLRNEKPWRIRFENFIGIKERYKISIVWLDLQWEESRTRSVKETESHVVVLLLGLLLLLLLLGLLGGGSRSAGGGRAGRGGSAGARADVGDELLDVDALERLGEEAGPVRLHLDLGGLEDGADLVTLGRESGRMN